MPKESGSNYQSDLDRESLLRARDQYEDVKGLIGELSTKLSKVSSHIEKEFLAAYRVHMLSVQEELRDLREAVVQAEKNLKEDHEVSTLESEVSWFTEETTRLRNQANAMKADIRHILNRISALKEQRQYLGEQLKTTLKRTRIMQADLEISVMNNENDWRTLGQGSNEFRNSDEGIGATLMQQSTEKKDSSAQGAPGEKEEGVGEQAAPLAPRNRGGGKGVKKSLSTSKLPPLTKKKTRAPPAVGGVQDPILRKSKSAAELGPRGGPTEELAQVLEARLPVELDLEEAIKSVFEEIVDRKVQSQAAGSSNTKGEGRNWRIDVPAAGGVTGLGLQHFSDNDRLSAIATFVAKPDIFARLTAILGADLQV